MVQIIAAGLWGLRHIQTSNTMKKTNIKKTCLAAAMAFGLAMSAGAQSVQSAPSDSVAADPGPGLVGNNYAELSYGYQKQEGAPSILHDYGFVSNANVFKNGSVGADANFTYDLLQGSAFGFDDHRQEAELGLTGFLMETWGKPFLTADAGMAWERAADASRKGFAYSGTGGVEFELTRNLALAPFVEYQADPHLYNHGLPWANFDDHLLDYGVKATLRITEQWHASVTADLDQHSDKDWGLKGGVSYRF
jgi:hypothetical protein